MDEMATRAIDGDTNGVISNGSVARTAEQEDPWWEVDLKSEQPVERIVLWNRSEKGNLIDGFRVVALDEKRQPVWEKTVIHAPMADVTFALTGARDVEFADAVPNTNQQHADVALVFKEEAKNEPQRKNAPQKGWIVGGMSTTDNALTLLLKKPANIPAGATLFITIEQHSASTSQSNAKFRAGVSQDARAADHTKTPAAVLAALAVDEARRNESQRTSIIEHFARYIAPQLTDHPRRAGDGIFPEARYRPKEDIRDGLTEKMRHTDKPAAALIKDLKQRGMLDDTLVVFGGEFGRTPFREGRTSGSKVLGRDHFPDAFSALVAGGGIKQGITYGETDELGFSVVQDKVHVHDLQATIMHLLGFDHTRLTFRFQGRDYRLTDVHGKIVKDILA